MNLLYQQLFITIETGATVTVNVNLSIADSSMNDLHKCLSNYPMSRSIGTEMVPVRTEGTNVVLLISVSSTTYG